MTPSTSVPFFPAPYTSQKHPLSDTSRRGTIIKAETFYTGLRQACPNIYRYFSIKKQSPITDYSPIYRIFVPKNQQITDEDI